MFVARDQENLVARHQTGAALKQQQNNGIGARYPKTPIKIPLNDENGGHLKGAKSILGNRTKGNENAASSKGLEKSNFVTPMQPRNRAVLGDKTTNAKSRGPQTVNAKSAVKSVGTTRNKAPTTMKPKQKQPEAEILNLQFHEEQTAPWWNDLEPEYCPPNPEPLPDGDDLQIYIESLRSGASQLRSDPEDLYDIHESGFYGFQKRQEELRDTALDDLDKQELELFDSFSFPSIEHEVEDENKKSKASSAAPHKIKGTQTRPAVRKPLTVRGAQTRPAVRKPLTVRGAQTKSAPRKPAWL
ncbi:hypothetical protein E8E14_004866 [Neopestalotiopsis sp. 37M]|nr:hypothetical protein E8E14_004866 [Neopestalotiopsis sp. 37M]